MSTNDLVRIRYCYQDENGEICSSMTGLMKRSDAIKSVKSNNLNKAEIVEAEEYEH